MRYLFLLTGFFAVLGLWTVAPAWAASVILGSGSDGTVPPTCDATIMRAQEAHAWLQGEREITQNANLIFKQDSVLQYSCFDRVLGHLSNATNSLFSDNVTTPILFGPVPPWTPSVMSPYGPQPPGGVFGFGNMETALKNLVEDSLVAYMGANFNHTMLGGRTGVGAAPSVAVVPLTYTCNTMNTVWTLAKCYNFQSVPVQDNFFTFAQYAGAADKRALPTACAPANWTAVLAVALTAPPWMTPSWLAQNNPSYLGRLNPSNCATITPVPTGIQVKPKSGPAYPDAVCPAPGCWYDPAGAGSCKP